MKLTNYGTVNTVPAYKNLEFSRSGSTGSYTSGSFRKNHAD